MRQPVVIECVDAKGKPSKLLIHVDQVEAAQTMTLADAPLLRVWTVSGNAYDIRFHGPEQRTEAVYKIWPHLREARNA